MIGKWLLAVGIVAGAPLAQAAVLGDEGIEIEGPHDRRGLYVRPGLSFGVQLPEEQAAPLARIALGIGAGLTKSLTLGVEGGLGLVFGDHDGVRPYADLEVSQFFGSGTFVRLGLGVAPVPAGRSDLEIGFGGRLGVGQEIWTGATRAFGLGLFYDGRIDADQNWVSGVIGSAYLAWY